MQLIPDTIIEVQIIVIDVLFDLIWAKFRHVFCLDFVNTNCTLGIKKK